MLLIFAFVYYIWKDVHPKSQLYLFFYQADSPMEGELRGPMETAAASPHFVVTPPPPRAMSASDESALDLLRLLRQHILAQSAQYEQKTVAVGTDSPSPSPKDKSIQFEGSPALVSLCSLHPLSL